MVKRNDRTTVGVVAGIAAVMVVSLFGLSYFAFADQDGYTANDGGTVNVYNGSSGAMGAYISSPTGLTDLNVTNDLVVDGDFSVGDDVAITGDADITGDVDVTGALTSGRFTEGGDFLASTTKTGVSAATMPISYLTSYNGLEYTLPNVAVTLTLPATSTMTALIPNEGDIYRWYLANLSTTAASSTTIAAGTGIDLREDENGDVVIEGGNHATLTFIRKINKDVVVIVEEWIVAD